MKCVIFLPALNEAATIQHVIRSLPEKLEGINSILTLVVDDGSTDNTAELAVSAGAHVISHHINRGVGSAFHSAIEFALEQDADVLVGFDADGQFDPLEITNIIQPIIQNKADMVIGSRFISGIPQNMPRIKYWGNQRVAKIINTVSGRTFQDVSCGFRAYSREALLRFNIFGKFTYTHETILSLAYHGLNIQEMPIHVKYDPARKSRVASSITNYAAQTTKIILRVLLDYRPMRVFGGFGSLCIAIGTGFELFLMGHYGLTGSFTPYKSTGFIGLGFIIFGMLVLIIALVADMLNRLRLNQDKLLYELKRLRYKH